MRHRWTPEEIERLKEMAAQRATVAEMAAALGRSETAVSVFLKKHRIRRSGSNTLSSQREERTFREDWNDADMSKARLLKKYGRTWTALRQKARKLELGPRPVTDIFLTRRELKAALGVTDGRLSGWTRQGLPVHKSKSNQSYGPLFDLDEVLHFLQSRQSEFDGSRLDESYFYHLPRWLREKCRRDCSKQNWHYKGRWTGEESSQLRQLFALGRSDAEMAETLGRTQQAIKARRFQLGLKRRGKS